MNIQINPSQKLIRMLATDLLAVAQSTMKAEEIIALEERSTKQNEQTGAWWIDYNAMMRELANAAKLGSSEGLWRLAMATMAAWDMVVVSTLTKDQVGQQRQYCDQIATGLISCLMELQRLRNSHHPGSGAGKVLDINGRPIGPGKL